MNNVELHHLQKDKLLSEICTFGIGGPAKYFLEVDSIAMMQSALRLAAREQIPYFIVGKGSNCLFDDRGFNGLVIQNKISFIDIDAPYFSVGAGYSFPLLGTKASKEGWGGLEFATGIPCSVGGAVFMNAGANGQDTYKALYEVGYVDEMGELHALKKHEIEHGYRYSAFHNMKGAIVSATFLLTPNPEAKKSQQEIVSYRIKTQPYGDKSAGCVFRNAECKSAGALIDECGLKGAKVGGAEVSLMHANFIVNREKATAEDVKKLIEHVQEVVKEKCQIELEPEIRVIDYDPQ